MPVISARSSAWGSRGRRCVAVGRRAEAEPRPLPDQFDRTGPPTRQPATAGLHVDHALTEMARSVAQPRPHGALRRQLDVATERTGGTEGHDDGTLLLQSGSELAHRCRAPTVTQPGGNARQHHIESVDRRPHHVDPVLVGPRRLVDAGVDAHHPFEWHPELGCGIGPERRHVDHGHPGTLDQGIADEPERQGSSRSTSTRHDLPPDETVGEELVERCGNRQGSFAGERDRFDTFAQLSEYVTECIVTSLRARDGFGLAERPAAAYGDRRRFPSPDPIEHLFDQASGGRRDLSAGVTTSRSQRLPLTRNSCS